MKNEFDLLAEKVAANKDEKVSVLILLKGLKDIIAKAGKDPVKIKAVADSYLQ